MMNNENLEILETIPSNYAVLTNKLETLSSSASAKTDAVDEYIQAEMQTQKIPGLSIAVEKMAKLLKRKGMVMPILNTMFLLR